MPQAGAEDPVLTPEIIDDLEEVEVSQESITRAMEINHAMETEDRQGSLIAALPFGVLALIGAALGGYGIASQFGLVRAEDAQSSFAAYLPAFLIVLGGLLFAVMAYYFVRTLLADD